MKRRYERPSAYIEEFTPNEYVAACGDSGTVYMFRCDAGGGYSGTVWLETNGEPGLQKKEDGKDGENTIQEMKNLVVIMLVVLHMRLIQRISFRWILYNERV